MNCIFCRILNKELPFYPLYEDDDFLVILDRYPTSRGHTLIIAKQHAKDIFELDDAVAGRLIPIAKKIASALSKALNFDGFNMLQNNGEAAGQSIPHFHIHLIPRYKGDDVPIGFHAQIVSDKELDGIKNTIEKVFLSN